MTRIFVGNLPDSATSTSVGELFAAYGKVERVALIVDQQASKPRGFGFVEMPAVDATRAIEKLHGQEFEGRVLKVTEAQERPAQGDRRRSARRR
jgi:RNA recognition motif-containing protein